MRPIKTRDFLVLAYGAFNFKIRGKTNVQKRVYFLGVGVSMESKLGYRAHYYGPYSDEVAEANSELRSMGYLSERSTSWGSDNRGFEISRYDYALTEDGRRLFERKKRENPQLWEKLRDFAEVMNGAGELNYFELSIAAKAYFIAKNAKKKISLEYIKEEASNLGWDVSPGEIGKACEFLEKVKLVSLSAA